MYEGLHWILAAVTAQQTKEEHMDVIQCLLAEESASEHSKLLVSEKLGCCYRTI